MENEVNSKTGKKRYFNFTEEEKYFLLFHVQKHKEVIDSRDTSGPSLLRKKAAWAAITKVFNQKPGNTKRTTRQLQKLFFNLKNKRKKELAMAEVSKNHQITVFENDPKKLMSDSEDYYDKDEFPDNKDDSNDDKDEFTDENNEDPMADLVNSTLPSVYEPIIKLEPIKRKYSESLDSERTLNDLKVKEAEVRLMIANEQLEEAKIKKETASLIQQYEIKYYEEKIKALRNMDSSQ